MCRPLLWTISGCEEPDRFVLVGREDIVEKNQPPIYAPQVPGRPTPHCPSDDDTGDSIPSFDLNNESSASVRDELIDFFLNAPIALHWLSPTGHVLWANRAELDALGYSAEEFIGHWLGEVSSVSTSAMLTDSSLMSQISCPRSCVAQMCSLFLFLCVSSLQCSVIHLPLRLSSFDS